jgi:thymidine phosphorylase
LIEITLALCTELLLLTKSAASADEAKKILQDHLASGKAYEKYEQMVRAQGGDPTAKLSVAPASDVLATKSGYLVACNNEQLGLAVIELGGGRKALGDKLDHSTGLESLVRLGQKIERGQPLARMFAHADQVSRVGPMIQEAWTIADVPSAELPLIVERIG